jgi:DNA-binding LacI/PurR family transcriptional regulator
VDGLKQALGDNGVKLEAENMILFKKSGAEDNRDLGRRLAADFFSGGAKDISAVFSPNDLIAAGVSDYLREAGINGVELCGYDNALPWISKDCGFSTVAVDYEKIGARAVSPMSKPSARAPKIVRVPPKLIPRDQPAQ